MSRKIILDVDTGSDDACAVMLAWLHPEIQLEAVCTVKGNQPLANTTENTLRIRDLLNADFPVYRREADGSTRAVEKVPVGGENVYPKFFRHAYCASNVFALANASSIVPTL